MRKHLDYFKRYLTEARDPSYLQSTFNFMALVSLQKDRGGNREETKNDIRAIPEVLTVSNVDPPEGIQRDLGSKFLVTWKVHARLPHKMNNEEAMRVIIDDMNKIEGCRVVRYQVLQAPRGGAAADPYGAGLDEEYQEDVKKGHTPQKRRLIGKGGQPNTAPYEKKPSMKRSKSAPAGFGGLEE